MQPMSSASSFNTNGSLRHEAKSFVLLFIKYIVDVLIERTNPVGIAAVQNHGRQQEFTGCSAVYYEDELHESG